MPCWRGTVRLNRNLNFAFLDYLIDQRLLDYRLLWLSLELNALNDEVYFVLCLDYLANMRVSRVSLKWHGPRFVPPPPTLDHSVCRSLLVIRSLCVSVVQL